MSHGADPQTTATANVQGGKWQFVDNSPDVSDLKTLPALQDNKEQVAYTATFDDMSPVAVKVSQLAGDAGHLYVYRHLGLHHCVNVVTGVEGRASAVLLRAGEVVEGADLARARRLRRGVVRTDVDLARGPARLTARKLGGSLIACEAKAFHQIGCAVRVVRRPQSCFDVCAHRREAFDVRHLRQIPYGGRRMTKHFAVLGLDEACGDLQQGRLA